MDKNEWTKVIRRDMKKAGTYQKFFESIIDTLADILSRRDMARASYQKLGGHPLIKHTNKAGAENIEQNPAIRLINDLDSLAMQYWKELGLTAASLKRINEDAVSGAKALSPLEKALTDMAKEKNAKT